MAGRGARTPSSVQVGAMEHGFGGLCGVLPHGKALGLDVLPQPGMHTARAPQLDSVLVSEGPVTNRTLNDTHPDRIPMGQCQVG